MILETGAVYDALLESDMSGNIWKMVAERADAIPLEIDERISCCIHRIPTREEIILIFILIIAIIIIIVLTIRHHKKSKEKYTDTLSND